MPEGTPLEHVMRPGPPWRPAELARTECGKDIGALLALGRPVLSREAVQKKIKDQGRQRAAFTTCMTCWDGVERWETWEENPVSAIGRETYGSYSGRYADKTNVHFRRFTDELLALAALAAAHPEEFEALLSGIGETVSLAERREARRFRGRS